MAQPTGLRGCGGDGIARYASSIRTTAITTIRGQALVKPHVLLDSRDKQCS